MQDNVCSLCPSVHGMSTSISERFIYLWRKLWRSDKGICLNILIPFRAGKQFLSVIVCHIDNHIHTHLSTWTIFVFSVDSHRYFHNRESHRMVLLLSRHLGFCLPLHIARPLATAQQSVNIQKVP